MKHVIRAGTWNIHEGIPATDSDREAGDELITRISESALDILALQEVPFDGVGNSPLLQRIAAHSALRYVSGFPLSQASYHPGFRSGVAIASRLPHTVENRLLLPNPRLRSMRDGEIWRSWDKGLIVAKIDFPEASIRLASVHCYPFHDFGRRASDRKFERIWHELANAVSRIPGPVILAGDFNTECRELLTRNLNQIDLIPVFSGVDTHDGRSVDDILHDVSIIRRDRKIIQNFSDHALCQAELIFEGPRTGQTRS